MSPTWSTADGSVRLFLGDCLTILPTLEAGSVDAVVTDPPYFQPAAHYCGARDEARPIKTLADMSILEHFFKSFCSACARLTKPTGSFYVFCDGQSYPLSFRAMYPHCAYVRPLIWDKLISYNGYTWRHQHELIAWGEGREAARIPTGDGDILRFRAVPVNERIHPAEKPQDLLAAILEKTADDAVVLDCFAGSAAVGVACVRADRSFIGIEAEERYFEIAVRRIEAELSRTPLFEPPPVIQTSMLEASE